MTVDITFNIQRMGVPAPGVAIKVRLLQPNAYLPDASVPRYDYDFVTDSNGEASIAVDTPGAGYSWPFSCSVDNKDACSFPLGDDNGPSITWRYIQENLCDLPPTPPSPDSVYMLKVDPAGADGDILVDNGTGQAVDSGVNIDDIGGQTLYDGADTTYRIEAMDPATHIGESWWSTDEYIKISAFESTVLGTTEWQKVGLLYDALTDTYQLPATLDGQTQNIGQEIFRTLVNRNGETATALNPQVFIANSVDELLPHMLEGVKAIASDISSGSLFGLNTTTAALNEPFKLTTYGRINGVNTSAWLPGTKLFVDPTTRGALTSTEPPINAWQVAVVLEQDATDGILNVGTINATDLADDSSTLFTGASFWATGDESVLGAGAFYDMLENDQGTVATATQTQTVGDDEALPLDQDWIMGPAAEDTPISVGERSAVVEHAVSSTGGSEKISMELYVTLTDGTPVDSGVTGAPVGVRGVPILLRLESPILTAPTTGEVYFANLTGYLAETVVIPAGYRARACIIVEKIGTQGGNKAFTVYFGNEHATKLVGLSLITSDDVANLASDSADKPTVTEALDNRDLLGSAADVQADLDTHEGQTTSVHGIADTSAILVEPVYLFKDIFSTDRLAGAVDGTPTDPIDGGYTRNVTDTGDFISVNDAGLVFADGTLSYYDTMVMYGGIDREIIKHIDFEVVAPTASDLVWFGLSKIATSPGTPGAANFEAGFQFTNPGNLACYYSGPNTEFGAIELGGTCTYRIVPVSGGGYEYWVRGANFGNQWQYLGQFGAGNSATLYPMIGTYNAAITCRSIKVALSGDDAIQQRLDNFWLYSQEPTYGRQYLRSYDAKIATIDEEETGQCHIGILGDSWARKTGNNIRDMLRDLYGNAGTGCLPFGDSEANHDGATITRNGTWSISDQAATSDGVSIQHVLSSDVGATMSFSANFTDGNLHYIEQVGGGSFQYRIDGGSWQAVSTVGAGTAFAQTTTGMTGLSNASHLVEIEITAAGSTGCILTEFMALSDVPGVIVSYLGNDGMRAGRVADVDAAIWENGVTALTLDTMIVQFGTNEKAVAEAPDTFRGYLQTIRDRTITALPLCDLLFLSPFDTDNLDTYSIQDYDNAIRLVATQNGAGFVGGARYVPNYANGLSRDLYANGNHPNDAGYKLLSRAILRFLE